MPGALTVVTRSPRRVLEAVVAAFGGVIRGADKGYPRARGGWYQWAVKLFAIALGIGLLPGVALAQRVVVRRR